MSTNGNNLIDKQLAPLPQASVQSEPQGGLFGAPGSNTMTLYLAQAADEIPAWGTAWAVRDRLLRELWPTEPTLAGVIPTIAARNAALSWKLDGPTRTVETVQTMLQSADFGGGWLQFIIKLTLDLLTQDNGAFMEVMREGLVSGEQALRMVERGQPLPPVTGIAHLDSACCIRTGNRTTPVIYTDPDDGTRHEMPWHMVIPLSEMPSPIKRMRNMQYSAVTRILRSAQIFRDYGIYKKEKISGRFTKSITIVGGPKQTELDDRLKRDQEHANNAGLVRYMLPTILASVDPTKPVSVATIELASLPDGFDYDAELRWYITQLALTFLEDYQTFAPLPGGNLGTSQQSIVLERKGRGKGVALWTKGLTHIFNFWGIMPRTVAFEFDETDTQADKDKADLLSTQIGNMVSLVQSGLMSAPVARQYMADNNIIYDEDYLAMQGEEDATPDETVTDEQPLDTTTDIPSLVGNEQVVPLDNEQPQVSQQPTQQSNGILPRLLKWLSGKRVTRTKASDAETLLEDFSTTIHEAVTGYIEGTLSKRSAQGAFVRAVSEAWPTMAELGYTDGGGDWAEADDDDTIDDETASQLAYVTNYWDDLPDIKQGETVPDARTDLYVQSLRGVYARYKALGAGNKKLWFRLGDTKEHCETCEGLNGEVHTAKYWIKNDLVPQQAGNENFSCGCWKCRCYLEDASGERWSV